MSVNSPSNVAIDAEHAELTYCEREDLFKRKLGEALVEFYEDRCREGDNAWRDVAGFAYSEVFQFAVLHILSRVGIHSDMNALVSKIAAARHAGLDNAALGEIFCREYDKLAKSRD